ncbi:MAG: alpha/beta hydrolase [Ktedonobacterales bacterium]|nr:alpha/beta hydrolase [Ktedonobacterales bacterium]
MRNLGATSRYAEVNGARLFYEVAGEGEPLVLLHAGVANLHMWDEQFPVFAQRYRVARYDLRGYGQSRAPAEQPYAPHEDLRALLDALDMPRAALVGCSIGGQTILDFALAYPDRAAALIPVGPGLSGYEPHSEEGKRFGAALEAAYTRGDLDTALDLATQMWIDGPSRSEDQVDPTMRAKARAMLAEALSLPDIGPPQPLDPPALGRLGAIRAPTLIIVGEQDNPDIQEICHLLAEGIPGARLASIADAAHLPNMDHPDQFNQLVLDFLASP